MIASVFITANVPLIQKWYETPLSNSTLEDNDHPKSLFETYILNNTEDFSAIERVLDI